jgi:hypothetical protein
MKASLLVIGLVLLLSCHCMAEQPVIRHVVDEPSAKSIIYQSFDLWIDAIGSWCLRGQNSSGLAFLDRDGSIVEEGKLICGDGSQDLSHTMEVHVEPVTLGPGTHRLDMELVLEGAQGILGLPLASGTWILPLNSEHVSVQTSDDERTFLPSGQWFLLQSEDRIFYDGQEIWSHSPPVEAAGILDVQSQSELWWDEEPLGLETGERRTFRIYLTGPSFGGELVLRSNDYLHIDGAAWFLEGRQLTSTVTPDGTVTLRIPVLPPGVHKLHGTLQALLPPPSGQGELWALWQGTIAHRIVRIDRSWFDHGGIQRIQVDTTSPLIMPSGRIRSMHGRGEVSVKEGRLNAVVPVSNPGQPIWTGLPLSDSIVWAPEIESSDPEDLFLPVLLWDDGLSWRLITSSGPWFLDVTAERQLASLRGRHGSVRLEASMRYEKVVITHGWNGAWSADGWRWWESAEVIKGAYGQGNWLWTIGVPRGSGNLPSLKLRYERDGVLLQMSKDDVRLKLSSKMLSWGIGLQSQTLWMERLEPHLRLELRPRHLKFDYCLTDVGDVRLQWNMGRSIQVDVTADPWDAYLRYESNQVPEWGLRYQKASSQGRFLSATKGALQVKNHTVMVEARGEMGYVLSPWCTPYVETGLVASIYGPGGQVLTHWTYGGGLILKPLPQIVAAVGWNSDQKWHVKAGVVVPFVGRKTQVRSE